MVKEIHEKQKHKDASENDKERRASTRRKSIKVGQQAQRRQKRSKRHG